MKWTQPTQVLIQGIAQPQVDVYLKQMRAYGTKLVAGVSVGQGGQTIEQIPVFDLVEEAIEQVGEVEATLIFVPPFEVLDAALEAIAAGIKQIIVLTKAVPPLDVMILQQRVQSTNTLLLGPGSRGILIPEQTCLGTFNPRFYTAGNVGLIGCSASLCNEVAIALNQAEIGQSLVVSMGKRRMSSASFSQWLSILEADEPTQAIILCGQPDCLQAAATVDRGGNKPIIAYLAGLHTPRERIFRDATTIIANQISYSVPVIDNDQQTISALKKAKIKMVKRPAQLPNLINKVLGKRT